MSINFQYIDAFAWFWFVPVAIVIMIASWKKISSRLHVYSGNKVFELVGGRLSKKRIFIKISLILFSICFLIVALTRPRWGYVWKKLPRSGSDIMVVLDLSRSMLATDINPSRIERAKRELSDLLNIAKGDRIGLVVFSGTAFVQCPLTVDYKLVGMFIRRLSPELIPIGGTNISFALEKAIASLEKGSSAQSEAKAIILMTDGEDRSGNPIEIAKKAKAKGIKIFTIGIGKEQGAPIPDERGGFKKDSQGNMVLSKLDEVALKSLASYTGGHYVRSTSGDMDLDVIYRQGIKIRDHGKSSTQDKRKIWHERFQWFLFFAFLLLFFEWFISEYTRKRSDLIRSLFMLSFMFFINTEMEASNLNQAREDFEVKKDYASAAKKFLDAQIEDPSNLKHVYNRAVSQYYNKEYKDHRKNMMFDTEKARFPETMPIVERVVKERNIQEDIRKIDRERDELREKMYALERKKRNKNNELYDLRYNNKSGEQKEKKVFIKKCPVGDCEGFLSSSWKCGVCSTWVCPDCFEIKGKTSDELTKQQLDEWGVKYHKIEVGKKPGVDVFVDDKSI